MRVVHAENRTFIFIRLPIFILLYRLDKKDWNNAI